MNISYGSACSGIEAATVAWHPLGWTPAWFSEIERFPCRVLAHHYPTVPNLGDMTTLPARILAGEVEAPDVFIAGTPCQAFSLAGWRLGLADARGRLTYTYVEILDAIDSIRSVRGREPAIGIWENVPGVLSDKGNAFGNFLAALVGEEEPLQPTGKGWTNAGYVLGPKRNVAWRILNSQYFGVPQQRRRVFVASVDRTSRIDPRSLLLEYRENGHVHKEGWHLVSPSSEAESFYISLPSWGHAESNIRAPTLIAQDRGNMVVYNATHHPRKLMPVEAERLQGFPDNYTNLTGQHDYVEARKKALGNSMTVPVIRWIGDRIEAELLKVL